MAFEWILPTVKAAGYALRLVYRDHDSVHRLEREKPELEAEKKRLEDEVERQKAEKKRLEDETERQKAEKKRLEDEVERQKAEKKRLEDEAERQKALLAAKEQEIGHLEAAEPIARFAGWYNDPAGLMPSITRLLEKFQEPQGKIIVAADFAAYGAITWNDEFFEQHKIFRRLCRAGYNRGPKLKMIVNAKAVSEEVIERQYKPDSWKKDHAAISDKLKKWISSELFKLLSVQDRAAPGSLAKVMEVGADRLTRRQFIDAFLEFNDRLLDLYEVEDGAIITRRTKLVPLHGWFARHDGQAAEGIFGVADVQAVWNEPGFWVRQDVANKMMNYIEDLASGN